MNYKTIPIFVGNVCRIPFPEFVKRRMKAVAGASLLVLTACGSGGNRPGNTCSQGFWADAEAYTESADGSGTETTYDGGHVSESEDGRISIASGAVPGGGTSPDYRARWTIMDDSGKEHVFMSSEASYQDKVHAITKTDGTVYYIVRCSDRAGSADGHEWLRAYRIVGDTVQEVNVADGGSNISGREFAVAYSIPAWCFATGGAGYDWILEYDPQTRNLYVPLTARGGIITDRYRVWHFDGSRFVLQGERPHKNLHESLAAYNTLIRYATTKDYILRIDSLDGGGLRYASWKRPKTMADKPDMIIRGGKRQHYKVKSDELCPCDDYRFRNGDLEYIVNYCEVKILGSGLGEHHDFLLIKRSGRVVTKQELK